MLTKTVLMASLAIATLAIVSTAAQDAIPESDPYIWLEDVHGAKPLAWVEEQNSLTQKALQSDSLYQSDYGTLRKLFEANDRIAYGSLFHDHVYNFWRDNKNPKGIWRRTTIADYANSEPHWETLLDVDRLAANEKEDWVWGSLGGPVSCAPQETKCLLSLSRGGTDAGVKREFDLLAKQFVDGGFTLPEAKSEARFVDENTVLFGTDFGQGTLTKSGYQRTLKLWRRGQSIAGAPTIFEGETDDLASWVVVHDLPTGRISIIMRAVNYWDAEYFYVMPDGSTLKLPLPLYAVFVNIISDQLFATLRHDWRLENGRNIPRESLIAFSLKEFLATRKLPEVSVLYTADARSSVVQAEAGRDVVYAAIYKNVSGTIHAFRYDPVAKTWSDKAVDLPNGGMTSIVSVNSFGPEAYFVHQSYLTPTTLYEDHGDNRAIPIKSLPARFDASRYVTTQYEATSKDGTKIPYSVVRAADSKGPSPTVLYGYGGFEVSQLPSYLGWGQAQLWIAKGGAYVEANIRGGGEFGPSWHEAAVKTNRQRSFDDFIAVAEDLIGRGITTPKQLGIWGGSNGGLLVATTMVERPELFGAVVCQIPILDMIRYPKIGAGPSWIAEYGDPNIPEERAALLKYSPYQNVKAGVKYPPILLLTATSDDRVTPVHARKMAAKMEAQGHDVLFEEDTDGGHSGGASSEQQARNYALIWTFFARKLGLAVN